MQIDSFGGENPPAGLYDFQQVIARGLDGFERVSDSHIAQFWRLGFLVIHNAIRPAAVQAARAGLRDLILRRAAENLMVESAAAAGFANLSDDERLRSVRKLMPIVPYDARLKALAVDSALLGVIARIMGEGPLLTQDMALIKPPRIGREKPWHQDMAYFNFPAQTPIVGAWIALDAALPENGCMMVIPGTHREGPVLHWTRRDWQICDADVQVGRSAAIPLPPGGCLLFHCLLHHGTPPSRSDRPRWAVQFHYRPASTAPLDSDAQRLQTFGSDGKDATC